MEKKDLNTQETFKVKESAFIGYLFSILFFAMFIGALVTINLDPNFPLQGYRVILYGTIFPAIIFLVKAIKTKTIMEVNRTGIWYEGNLITSWQNYVSSYMFQEEIPGSLDENIRLCVEYYVPDRGINYISNLKMLSTQDKSEEQIMSAINDFSLKATT